MQLPKLSPNLQRYHILHLPVTQPTYHPWENVEEYQPSTLAQEGPRPSPKDPIYCSTPSIPPQLIDNNHPYNKIEIHFILSIYATARNTTCCHTLFHQLNITKSWTRDLYPICRNMFTLIISARLVDNPARHSHGIRMYNKYAELSHLPKVLIKESSTPQLAVVKAAPIQKM